MLLFPIFLSNWRFAIRDHSRLAWFPVGGADLSIFVSVLKSLHQSKILVNAATHGKVINGHVPKNPLSIDDVGCSERDSIFLNQALVILSYRFCLISNHRNLHFAKPTLFPILLSPLLMRKMRINAYSDHFGISRRKLTQSIIECDNF